MVVDLKIEAPVLLLIPVQEVAAFAQQVLVHRLVVEDTAGHALGLAAWVIVWSPAFVV